MAILFPVPEEGENQNGKVSMHTAANSSFILTKISSKTQLSDLARQISYGGLYQEIALELIKGFQTTQTVFEFAARLVPLVEHNYAHFCMEAVEQISQVLISLPVAGPFKHIGEYYLAMRAKHQGRFDEAQAQLETLAGDDKNQYKSRAIMSLAAMSYKKGNYQAAFPLYIEAARAAKDKRSNDLVTLLDAQRMLAVLKSIDGDHKGALASLDAFFPFVRAIGRWQPFYFYQYLNSFAVELAEAGRLEEARRASETAFRSPYAHAYPGWRETRDEISIKLRAASRSYVPGIDLPVEASNVTHLQFAECANNLILRQPNTAPPQKARIISFEEWNKMSKEANHSQDKLAQPQAQKLAIAEKQAELLKLIYADNVSEVLLDKLLKAAQDTTLSKQANY